MRRAPAPRVRVPAMRKAPPPQRGGRGAGARGAGARLPMRAVAAPAHRGAAAPRRPAVLPMRAAPAAARGRDAAVRDREAAVPELAERWVHYRSSQLSAAISQLKSGGLVELEVLDTSGVMRGLLVCEVIGTALDQENGLPLTYVTPLAADNARILQWATGNISAPNAVHFANRKPSSTTSFRAWRYPTWTTARC